MKGLVVRAQRGDAVALDALVRELEPYVGRICAGVCLDAADDAAQEALIAIVRHLPSLRSPHALRAWARRIAVREALRLARHGKTVPIDPSELDVSASVPDGATETDVRAVLERLPPHQRAVLVLRHLEQLTEAEMADALGVEHGTVKSRLHRARAAFRERWTS